MQMPNLTSFSKSSGCGCKIHPTKLHEIISQLKPITFNENVLSAFNTMDDASVIKFSDDLALITTVDFFTPLLNDPYQFGRIASANAISDIYAMGAKPVNANAILGWPVDILTDEMAGQVLQGAQDLCNEAGIQVNGGHSINIAEPIFGLSVSGIHHPKKIKFNCSANENDLLYLTKPLGIGMLATSIKREIANEDQLNALIEYAGKLNFEGEWLGQQDFVSAMTDITGFGFYGHLLEMLQSKKLSALIHFNQIPLIDEARPLAEKFIVPDNTFRNWNSVNKYVHCNIDLAFSFFNDPQTNGGLLFSVDAKNQTEFEQKFEEKFKKEIKPIGKIYSNSTQIEVIVE
jgi:selenide,water dikinase